MNNFFILVVLIANSFSSSAQVPDHSSSFESRSGFRAGFERTAEIGYIIGMGNYGRDFLKLNGKYGYRLNPYLSLALGTGLSYDLAEKDVLIPLFTNVRLNFTKKYVSPYWALGVGYSFDITRDFSIEGIYPLLNSTAGVRFEIADKYALYVGIGYDKQRLKSGKIINTDGIGINIGFSF